MLILAENIVFVCLIPVIAQIILPLGILLYKGGQALLNYMTGAKNVAEPELESAGTAVS